jgi:hypothetical protein
MALVSFVPPVPVEIPHEPGNFLTFRRPASRIVREARKVVEKEGRQGIRDFGVEIVKALNEGEDDERAMRRVKRLEAEQEYHPDQFDRDTLLRSAIVGWDGPNYEDEAGRKAPVTPENIGQLDEPTARWAHNYVVDLIKPPTKEADKSAAAAAAPAS